jgi:hypothetical protein
LIIDVGWGGVVREGKRREENVGVVRDITFNGIKDKVTVMKVPRQCQLVLLVR